MSGIRRDMTPHEQDMAMLSAHVYGDTKVLPNNWAVVEGSWQVNEQTGFAAAVYRNSETGEQVIAFRGTDDKRKDLANDLQILVGKIPEQLPEALAYYNKWTATIMSDPAYTIKGVSLTGHSLGGALAQLVAMEAARSGYWHDTFTFNAPGVDGLKEIEYTRNGLIIKQKEWSSKNIRLDLSSMYVKNFVIRSQDGGERDIVGNYEKHFGLTINLDPKGRKPLLSEYTSRGAKDYLLDVGVWLHSIDQFLGRNPNRGEDTVINLDSPVISENTKVTGLSSGTLERTNDSLVLSSFATMTSDFWAIFNGAYSLSSSTVRESPEIPQVLLNTGGVVFEGEVSEG